MKSINTHFISILCTLVLFQSHVLGQIVVQHLGALDPTDQGFTLFSGGNVQIGPVVDDGGFDSWQIRKLDHNSVASYSYSLTPEELDSAMTHGWEITARLRFVEIGDFTRSLIDFTMGTTRFRLSIRGVNDSEIVVAGDSFDSFSLEVDALAYHEYRLAYDPTLEEATLWIDDILMVTEIVGWQLGQAFSDFHWGATGESITYSHWNEVTFAIVPEPATVTLLSGLGALVVAAGARWRRRRSA